MLIKSKTKLKEVIDQAKKAGKKVLVKRGVFDIIHPGHIATIKSLGKIADMVIIMVASDKLVKKRKGDGRPINSQKIRAEVVDGLKGIDYVYLENSVILEDVQKILEYLKPDIVAMTHIEPKLNRMPGHTWKIKMMSEKSRPEYSSTKIINKIRGG